MKFVQATSLQTLYVNNFCNGIATSVVLHCFNDIPRACVRRDFAQQIYSIFRKFIRCERTINLITLYSTLLSSNKIRFKHETCRDCAIIFTLTLFALLMLVEKFITRRLLKRTNCNLRRRAMSWNERDNSFVASLINSQRL